LKIARRLKEISLRRGFVYRPGGKKAIPHPLALEPFLLDSKLARSLLPTAAAFHRLHKRLPSLHSSSPSVRAIIPLERRALWWLAVAPKNPAAMILRLDVGLGANGPFVCETNATALAGYHYQDAAAAILKELSLVPSGFSDAPSLLEFLRRWLTPLCPSKRVGFVEPPPFGPGDTEMPRVARYLRTFGWETAWGTPSELSSSGMKYFLRDKPVDLLFRDVNYKDMLPPDSPRLRVFRRMVEEGRCVPGPGAEFDHKGILELCTSDEFSSLFTAHERKALRAVPWTRTAFARNTTAPSGKKVDLFEFLRREPSKWLLKPNRDCGGAGIVLGLDGRAAWERALSRAAREPGEWVVQERRADKISRFRLPRNGGFVSTDCHAVLGVYYGGQDLGFYARVSPRRVVNVAGGGALAAVFLR
jgi:hypothetical protein